MDAAVEDEIDPKDPEEGVRGVVALVMDMGLTVDAVGA